MEIHRDIPYTQSASRNRLHEFDLYIPTNSTREPATKPLICFVHGGAWRSEDKSDHACLAERLAHHTGFPVAVPNYRLTPRGGTENSCIQHPSHAEDILHFLEFLISWDGSPEYGQVHDPSQLFLMGHSCSAHMLACILLDSSAVTPTLTPSAVLLNAVKGLVFSEGIYDLDLLIARFPDYLEWFIAPAFGTLESYAAYASTVLSPRTIEHEWLLVHSVGDTLVDLGQSEKMMHHLMSEYGPEAKGRIALDTSLTRGHDDILATEGFVILVGRFVRLVLQKCTRA